MSRIPATPATRFLQKNGVAYIPHVYEYVEHGGTRHSAAALGVDEHCVIKTLIMADERQQPLIVLMHGDHLVSAKELARAAGVKHVEPCTPETARRHSGYLVGGTSPFATRKTMPVYIESSILELERIYINGGQRGLLVSLAPAEIVRVLGARPVQVKRAK